MKKKFLPLLFAATLFAGCSSITNLTPSQLPRNAGGVYTVEAGWRTEQQSIRPTSVKPSVMIGMESYPMRPVPLVRDRWEAVIPVAAEKDATYYRFRFDYLVNAIPVPHADSKLSPEYKLQIVDKK